MPGSEPRGTCPACQATGLEPLFLVERSPVLTGVLCATRDEALGALRRTLDLHLCGRCGTLVNVAFDPDLVEYDGHYDNSLHYSSTFRAYATELAHRLITTHRLASRPVVEIGSGKGDFLRELCSLAGTSGTGYDPTYIGPQRAEDVDVAFVVDYYGPRYRHLPGDFVVCRHVLEHVTDPRAFLENIREALGDREASIYLEVPNGGFLLSEAGAWDYIYPHVTYFSPAGLSGVVTAAGFEVTAGGTAFGEQFLWVEAKTAGPEDAAAPSGMLAPGEDLAAVSRYVEHARSFGRRYPDVISRWMRELDVSTIPPTGPTMPDLTIEILQNGSIAEPPPSDQARVLVWGAGSKGVNFLNVIGPGPAVLGVVDLNPNKQGTFIPGTGHQVIAPEEVPGTAVTRVLLANALYLNEVRALLDDLDVRVDVVPL
ncbi:class I SAM-dependent methyltransferase [Parafrankia elaeagni]|uniref:class I SAM-dependent methyltransferase n=1 Tax=Parafrankia elaeagni TaxID=222534 RepID=UPI000556F851|nr:class I SAM-dependent methyltransferase [Parafrankia elaeagni]